MRGEFEDARAICARARTELEEVGQSRRLADLAEVTASIEMLAGAPDEAERDLRFSYETLKRIGDTAVLSTVAAELAEALYIQGRLEEAERVAEESAGLAAGDDVESQVRWRMTRAKVLARQGHFEDAEQLAREAVRLATEAEFPNLLGDALMTEGEVLKLAGADEEANRAASRALAVYESKGNVVSAAKARDV
jgi:tetratricopeptide (TPR) repeat protein